MFGNLGAWEVLLILLVVLLVFGAKRIPEIARGLGKGIREFKDATNDIKKELTVADAPPRGAASPPQQIGYPQPPYQPAAYPSTPQQAPPVAAQPGSPPPPAPPTEGQPPV